MFQECDRNRRVLFQAASNTMTEVDKEDMDRIMSVQHLLGSSDERWVFVLRFFNRHERTPLSFHLICLHHSPPCSFQG